jgi:hypothetical protein
MSFIYSPLCNTAPQAENHRTTARRKRLTLLPMTGLCSGCHLPSRRGVANSKVSFELRPRQTLILKCLGQERPFLIRTERCSLPIQRSDSAVPARVFQNSLPTHVVPRFCFWSSGLCTGRFSKSLASLAETTNGLRTVDLRRSTRLSGCLKLKDRTCYVGQFHSTRTGRCKVIKRKAATRKPYTAADIKLLKQHSRARTPVSKIARQMKRSVGSLRQKALKLGIGLGHQR